MNAVNARTACANRVTWTGFFANLALTAAKLVAGIWGHSAAMVADAVHSLSDFATDVVVLASFRMVGKPADKDHSYGHGKYETMATAIIGIALLLVGAGIFWSGASRIWDVVVHASTCPRPARSRWRRRSFPSWSRSGCIANTVRAGREIESQAVIATLGTTGRRVFLDRHHVGHRRRHPAGRALARPRPAGGRRRERVHRQGGVRHFLRQRQGMVEASLDETAEADIIAIVAAIPGVGDPTTCGRGASATTLRWTSTCGVDPDLRVQEAHDIASEIERACARAWGDGPRLHPRRTVAQGADPRTGLGTRALPMRFGAAWAKICRFGLPNWRRRR
jgi:divalent metal cation (Fe/Co/Zn/Cd) transporter